MYFIKRNTMMMIILNMMKLIHQDKTYTLGHTRGNDIMLIFD